MDVPNKAEAFVFDIIGSLMKLDANALQKDYQHILIGIDDIKKIIAALQELDYLKNSL